MTVQEMTAAIDALLRWEGRTFTPGDPAAGDPPTKFGITATTLGRWRNLGRAATPVEVAALEESEARDLYCAWYIVGPRFAELRDARVRQFCIDFGVNSGTDRAAWYLQKAVGVTPDMRIGPVTLAAIAAADQVRLLGQLVRARVEVLARWIRARPAARVRYVAVIDRAVSFLPAL